MSLAPCTTMLLKLTSLQQEACAGRTVTEVSNYDMQCRRDVMEDIAGLYEYLSNSSYSRHEIKPTRGTPPIVSGDYRWCATSTSKLYHALALHRLLLKPWSQCRPRRHLTTRSKTYRNIPEPFPQCCHRNHSICERHLGDEQPIMPPAAGPVEVL